MAVMSLLLSVREAEFTFLREKTGATAGNLSVQLGKLKDAGYLTLTRELDGSYPLTRCAITPRGVAAFEAYVQALQSYLKPLDSV
nr:transcriptional regulator [Hymenobacter translucens]